MLARTADSVFWLGRYMERMDYLARLMRAAQQMASVSGEADEWRSMLIAAGCAADFWQTGRPMTAAGASHFLACEPTNPSSLLNCLDKARLNARAVRTALSSDVWDAVNQPWLESRQLTPIAFTPERLPQTLDWVKAAATRFTGAVAGTLLRNESQRFMQLGASLERADNTARILDVKYHLLLPSHAEVGGLLDYYQWLSILQAVSASRAYHWLYRGEVTPWNVAELLILRQELPRSLRCCYDFVAEALTALSDLQGGRRGEPHRRAGVIASRLRFGRIEDIFQGGLHQYLTEIVDDTAVLGREITNFYMR